jgi:hypothetical protein
MRLGWDFDFADLLSQPLLLRDWLRVHEREITEMARGPEDILLQGCLLWGIIYKTVYEMKRRNPAFITVRHEDLSRDPSGQFPALFGLLGLDFSEDAARAVRNHSGDGNPAEISRRNVHSVRLDSRTNLENWKHRLTPREIERVRELTADICPLFYDETDWER